MTQKRPYKKNNRSRTTSYSSNRMNTKTKNTIDDELSKTKKLHNTVRIRIDEERLNDSDSLDTSFLSGRVKKNEKENKRIKEKLLRGDKSSVLNPTFFKILFFLLGTLCIVIVVIMVIVNYDDLLKTKTIKETPVSDIQQDNEKVIDDNYLFIGNYYLEEMDFKELEFYKPTVKVVESDITTNMILEDLNHYIYQYNPSHVILQVGLKELIEEENVDDIINRYRTILEGIQENRPYAKILIESLYPIYSDDDDYDNISNDMIVNYNEKLNDLASSFHITYIDVYSELDSSYYSEDGLYLNSDGVKKVWKIIRKFM